MWSRSRKSSSTLSSIHSEQGEGRLTAYRLALSSGAAGWMALGSPQEELLP